MTAELHRPDTLAGVFDVLDSRPDAVVYGGGTAIRILDKQGVLFASDLVSLQAVPGLDTVVIGDRHVRLGPMVRLRTLERDPRIARCVPLLSLACAEVANPRVRNTATIGGNLAHGDYRLDPPVALSVLDASVGVMSTGGERSIPVRELFTGFEQTALDHREIITSIEIPLPRSDAVSYVKLSSLAANDWPCASVGVSLWRGATGALHATVGLGALAPTVRVLEVDLAADDLDGATEAVLAATAPYLDPLPDIRGGVAYKLALGAVAVADAVAAAYGRLP